MNACCLGRTRFEYSRVDPKKHERETGLAYKISLSLEEFNLDVLAVALTHLMPLHSYSSQKSLGVYSPIMDRMMDVVLKYKMADKECIRGITYLAACYFRQAGEKVRPSATTKKKEIRQPSGGAIVA